MFKPVKKINLPSTKSLSQNFVNGVSTKYLIATYFTFKFLLGNFKVSKEILDLETGLKKDSSKQ